MGGIIATESVLASVSDNKEQGASGFASPRVSVLPYIQGILAFDTPYLGIAPSVLIYGANAPYQSAHALYTQTNQPSKAKGGNDEASVPTWRRWATHAMVAVFLAGSAYFTRSALNSGWEWVSSHLLFVECLLHKVELTSRLDRMMSVARERGMGFANFVVILGEWSFSETTSVIEKAAKGEMRAFCEVPQVGLRATLFHPVKNASARDEITAHMSIFAKQKNPEYQRLCLKAMQLIRCWVQKWYDEESDNSI